MIRIEEVKTLPRRVELELMPYAAEEYRTAKHIGFDVIGQSRKAWVLWHGERPILACGIHQNTMIGSAWFWFLLCHGFRPSYARELRTLLGILPVVSGISQPLMTYIEDGFTTACRFAKFFGFVPTGEHHHGYGRSYEIYRVR